MPIFSRFNPIVLGFLPTEINTTLHSKFFLSPFLSIVEIIAPDLFFFIFSTLYEDEN